MRSSIQKRLFFVPVCFLLLISCSWAQTGTTSCTAKFLIVLGLWWRGPA